jgi:hypothetical protein
MMVLHKYFHPQRAQRGLNAQQGFCDIRRLSVLVEYGRWLGHFMLGKEI